MFIEMSIVLAGAESSILFLDKEEWGCLWGLGLSDLARLKMFINKFLVGFHLLGIHRIGLGHFQYEDFFKVNGVVKGSSWGELPDATGYR